MKKRSYRGYLYQFCMVTPGGYCYRKFSNTQPSGQVMHYHVNLKK